MRRRAVASLRSPDRSEDIDYAHWAVSAYDLDHMIQNISPMAPDALATRLLAVMDGSRVTRQRVSRDAAVFRQGDPAAAVFVVETGRVRLVRFLGDGTPLVLHVAEAGESFAEASLSAAHYHCDAVADVDTIVLALPKTALLAALAADPAESLAVMLALAAQVRDLRARLELRNIRSANERILAWLGLHASGDPPRVAMRRSWIQIANELGLTREAVYRALAQLERRKQIGREAGTVYLLAGGFSKGFSGGGDEIRTHGTG
jgi:CRP-like cAMP-binding protein